MPITKPIIRFLNLTIKTMNHISILQRVRPQKHQPSDLRPFHLSFLHLNAITIINTHAVRTCLQVAAAVTIVVTPDLPHLMMPVVDLLPPPARRHRFMKISDIFIYTTVRTEEKMILKIKVDPLEGYHVITTIMLVHSSLIQNAV